MMDLEQGRSWEFEMLPDLPAVDPALVEKRPFTPPEKKEYGFYIGRTPNLEKGKLALNITEIPNRSAEGWPMYLEQEAWVRQTLKQKRIQAREIWFSNWEFETTEDAEKFATYLDELTAATDDAGRVG